MKAIYDIMRIMRGFLAVLLLVTVIVFALWMVKGGGEKVSKDIQAFDSAKHSLTITKINVLEREIITFIAENSRPPETLNDLGRTVKSGAARKDAWGVRFRYHLQPDNSFRIVSAGQDGIFGTEDDIIRESRF